VLKVENLSIDPSKFESRWMTRMSRWPKRNSSCYTCWLQAGRVFLRNEILNQVWGNEVIVGDRTIDVHIRKIRQKLGWIALPPSRAWAIIQL